MSVAEAGADVLVAAPALLKLRQAILAGLPNGRRLLAMRGVEAAIDRVAAGIQAVLTAGTPDAVARALRSSIAIAWRAVEGPPSDDPQAHLAQLQQAWMAGALPDAERGSFERYATLAGLGERLAADHPGLAWDVAGAAEAPIGPAVEALLDAYRAAITVENLPYLRETLVLVMAAQRRRVGIPDGPQAAARWQEMWRAYAACTMPSDEREVFNRNIVAASIDVRLRAAHPSAAQPSPPFTPEELELHAMLRQRAPALDEAQSHTVPGSISPEWLDRLAGLLDELAAVLDGTKLDNRARPYLCFTMAGAAFALGRGREQILQASAALDAYGRAAALYDAAGEPDDAQAARAKTAWLTAAMAGDVDRGTFDDLRRLAHGIADPFDRAEALGRLSSQATQANDHHGARQYADACFLALAEAGFPDPQAVPLADAMARWIDEAAARRSGDALPKLLTRVGGLAESLLLARHTDTILTDPAQASAIEALIERLQAAVRLMSAQVALVNQEVADGLSPYVDLQATAPPQHANLDPLLALMRRVTALETPVRAEPDLPASTDQTVDELVAAAAGFGQPGPIAHSLRLQALLRRRRGDLEGAERSARLGEAALLPDGRPGEHIADRTLSDFFLMLRSLRMEMAAAADDAERTLALAEGAIRIIEADRYRINDPLQQGTYLADRTVFYELAALSAFKLERWDTLVEVSDLFKSRSALRSRLAPPPDQDSGELARQVAAATAAIEAAAPEQRDVLRAQRRRLWSLLSITRMRGAVEELPTLSVAAVQASLAMDEAVVSWVWVSSTVLIVLALDRERVHAERVILTDAQGEALTRHVEAIRSARLPRASMELNVQPVAEAVLPPATRDFISAARRLVFSPHRALHLLPLHAARLDGRFLIERASVRYVPNLGSLVLPWHGTEDGAVLSLGINEFGRGLRRLGQAEAEAEEVAAAWAASGRPATRLIGAAATRDAFTALKFPEYRCLHLATHAESVYANALQGDPFASRLCFADGDIEALSLAALPLRADLVVLSACNSLQRALDLPGSPLLPGDDLFGLQACLFQAGVRSVLGALWPVDDGSALQLLPELHRGLAAGAQPEVAWQSAVRAYLANAGTKKAIYYWAALSISSFGRMSSNASGATQ